MSEWDAEARWQMDASTALTQFQIDAYVSQAKARERAALEALTERSLHKVTDASGRKVPLPGAPAKIREALARLDEGPRAPLNALPFTTAGMGDCECGRKRPLSSHRCWWCEHPPQKDEP